MPLTYSTISNKFCQEDQQGKSVEGKYTGCSLKKICKRDDLNADEELSIIVTVSLNQPDRTELYIVYRK